MKLSTKHFLRSKKGTSAVAGAATVAAGMKHGVVLAKSKIRKVNRYINNVNTHTRKLSIGAEVQS